MRIDKNRKIPVTVFLRALGLGDRRAASASFFGEDRAHRGHSGPKTATNSEEEGLLETYRKLRPGEPPTVESAQSHLNSLFFDARRYDLSRVGRYKYEQEAGALPARIAGHVAARDIVDPADRRAAGRSGRDGDRAEASRAAEAAGVMPLCYLTVDEQRGEGRSPTAWWTRRSFSRFDPAECGINEKVSFAELRDILDETGERGGAEGGLCAENHDELIPKHSHRWTTSSPPSTI